MAKRRCAFELNTWVLVRPRKRPWRHASPALVSQIPTSDDGKYDDGLITVLFPNMMVLQHCWTGRAYWEERVSAADIRPYEGAPRQQLIDRLLRGIQQVNFNAQLVEDRRIRRPLRRKLTSSDDETSLLNVAFESIADFGGLLAEYLWSEERTTKTSLETVSSEDCPGSVLQQAENTTTFSVPICEPMIFALMRTSRRVCGKTIAGIKARSRIDCDSDVSIRYMSIIAAVTQAAFPKIWKQTRLLCVRPTTEDEPQRMGGALRDVLEVKKARRKSLLANFGEMTLDEDEADEMKEAWQNFARSSTGKVHSIANVLFAAFSQSYKRDPYIIGLPRLELETSVFKELGCDASALSCALWELQSLHKIHLCGDLVFPL